MEKDKIHWISWEMVKTPTIRGGLGVQDLRILNSALLSKWYWRYAVERNAWWRLLITAKCDVGSSEWRPTWNIGPAGNSFWRWLVAFSPIFWTFGYLDPGGGLCAFWFDTWVRGVRFFDAFPRIAAAVTSLETNVADLCFFDNRRRWHIPLKTTLRGGALEEWNQLMLQLDELPEGIITAPRPLSGPWKPRASSRFDLYVVH
ncbi:hypothetical protein LINPERHAP1_LOCUS24949 [Linum perenne]